MNKSIRYNTFTTSKMQIENEDITAAVETDSILLEGTLVLSTSSNIQGIRKLTALDLSVSARNSYLDGSHVYDLSSCETITAQIMVVPEGELYTRLPSTDYTTSFPLPQQTIGVCSLQYLLQNGFKWTGSFEIPPKHYVVCLLYEVVPNGTAPKHQLKGLNYLFATANMRLSF